MAILPIITVPNKVLEVEAEYINNIDDTLIALAKDMSQTMYSAPGIGLAANQIGKPIRMVVVDVDYAYAAPSEKVKKPIYLINPRITLSEGSEVKEEGCLSVPEFGVDVKRALKIQLKAEDLDGAPLTIEAEGLLARALQHELDHLKGTTILSHASPLKRRLYQRRVKKMARRMD